MRKFRESLKDQELRQGEPSYDTKQLKDEVHLLSLLDSCSQILRDDRIWLRKRVKDSDVEVIRILKAATKGAVKQINLVNLKQLQINLRKYISKVKERQKEEQLVRFKENILVNDFKKKNRAPEEYSIFAPNNRQQERPKEGLSLPRQPSFLSKIPEPIEEEEYSEKESSYPSRSSEPYPQYQRDLSHKNLWNGRKEDKNSRSRRSSRDRKSIDNIDWRESITPLKQSKSNSALNSRKASKPEPRREAPERNILKDLKLDTFREKEELLTFKPLNNIGERAPVVQPDFADMSSGVSISSTPHGNSRVEVGRPSLKPKDNNESLFTSPELLMECRMFIERNSQSKRKDFVLEDSKVSSKTYVQFKEETKEEKIRQEELPEVVLFKEQQYKMPAPTQIPRSEETPLRVSIGPIEQLLAEEAFDQLVSGSGIISNFHSLLTSKFSSSDTLLNIISQSGDEISPEELGALLQEWCQKKSNPVKDLYNYINLDQNGYVTIEDLETFLSQVLESEADPMYSLGMSVFEMAARQGRVEYWGLYQRKQAPEMKEFLRFLSQFEFQVES